MPYSNHVTMTRAGQLPTSDPTTAYRSTNWRESSALSAFYRNAMVLLVSTPLTDDGCITNKIGGSRVPPDLTSDRKRAHEHPGPETKHILRVSGGGGAGERKPGLGVAAGG